MNTALIFALAVAFAMIIGGALLEGRGSLRRGVRHIANGLRQALTEALFYVVLVAAALVVAVLAGGDAWSFVAIALAGAGLIALLILVIRRRRRH